VIISRSTPSTSAAAPLYARLLGEDWPTVADEVRRAHYDDRSLERRGLFRVHRGIGFAARAIAALMRLPPAAEGVPVDLRIEAVGDGERWIRHFGRKRLTTYQRPLPDGLLGERFGPMELAFRVTVIEGEIRYASIGARLRVGPFGIPLPRFLSPRVEAREAPGSGGATQVMVEVSLPWIGRLIRYEGLLYEVVP
jgi:hypothetical protein